MIRHFFKLAWNRRRANGFILAELLLCFLTLGAVLTIACFFLHNWRQPLGFEYRNVWRLDLSGGNRFEDSDDGQKAQGWARVDQILRLLRSRDEIESVSPLYFNVPFGASSMLTANLVGGTQRRVLDNRVGPEAREVLGLRLVAGRWLEPGDEALAFRPVVLSRSYAHALFGDADPIGKTLVVRNEDGKIDKEEERRVVGVVEAWRQYGELSHAPLAQFSLPAWGPPHLPPGNFVLKIRPGVSPAFEEDLVRAVRRIAPDWTVSVSSLARHRDRLLRDRLLPLLIMATVAGFLILMVGLGLTGVLWQSITRRTQEIGLRRALGATPGQIRWQILGELLALAALAAGAGSLIILQAPLLGIFDEVPLQVYLFALTLAALSLSLLVVGCGLYPSWLATRIRPAHALQYE